MTTRFIRRTLQALGVYLLAIIIGATYSYALMGYNVFRAAGAGTAGWFLFWCAVGTAITLSILWLTFPGGPRDPRPGGRHR